MTTQKHTVLSLHTRVAALEALANDVTKIKNMVKVYAPLVIVALVSSGIVDGKWGAFLNALFTGG